MTSLLVSRRLLVHIACNAVRGESYDSSLADVRRTMELAKVRRAKARGTDRRAAAMAERWRNIASAIGVEWRGGGWWWSWKVEVS